MRFDCFTSADLLQNSDESLSRLSGLQNRSIIPEHQSLRQPAAWSKNCNSLMGKGRIAMDLCWAPGSTTATHSSARATCLLGNGFNPTNLVQQTPVRTQHWSFVPHVGLKEETSTLTASFFSHTQGEPLFKSEETPANQVIVLLPGTIN